MTSPDIPLGWYGDPIGAPQQLALVNIFGVLLWWHHIELLYRFASWLSPRKFFFTITAFSCVPHQVPLSWSERAGRRRTTGSP